MSKALWTLIGIAIIALFGIGFCGCGSGNFLTSGIYDVTLKHLPIKVGTLEELKGARDS